MSWSFVRGIPSSVDLFFVDFKGELIIDCSKLSHDSRRFTGLPERNASFALLVSNNLLSHFDIVLRVGGFFLSLSLNLGLIVFWVSPVLWRSCTHVLVAIRSSSLNGL